MGACASSKQQQTDARTMPPAPAEDETRKKKKGKVKPGRKQEADFENKFAEHDTDGSGYLCFGEFLSVCQGGELDVDNDAVRALFDMLDCDQSGVLELKELNKTLARNADARALAKQYAGLVGLVKIAEGKTKKTKKKRGSARFADEFNSLDKARQGSAEHLSRLDALATDLGSHFSHFA